MDPAFARHVIEAITAVVASKCAAHKPQDCAVIVPAIMRCHAPADVLGVPVVFNDDMGEGEWAVETPA